MGHKIALELFSENLRDVETLRREYTSWRKKRGMRQTDIAWQLGVTQSAISAFERGTNRTMRRQTLNAIRQLVSQWQSEENILQFAIPNTQSLPGKREPNQEGVAGGPTFLDSEKVQDFLKEMRRALMKFWGNDPVSLKLVDTMSPKELTYYYAIAQRFQGR